MSVTPTVRDATADDVVALTELSNALVSTTTVAWTAIPETVAERAAWFDRQERSGNPVLVADVGGAVVGFATYGHFRDTQKWPGYRFTAELTIHVDRRQWGRGVGRALMNALVERARRAGKHVLIAAIDGENEGSVRFHERLGFEVVGRLPEVGHKFGRWLDLVLMQRVLDPGGNR